jgi:hypothetical protein
MAQRIYIFSFPRRQAGFFGEGSGLKISAFPTSLENEELKNGNDK